jgi:hypothetical protein
MWYRLAHIRGEYWLNENGPVHADGDLGDDNHEMIAETHMLNELRNDIESPEYWGAQTYNNARLLFMEAQEHPGAYMGQMPEFIKDLQAQYGNEWWDYADYDSYLIWLNTRHFKDEAVKKRQQEWTEREIRGFKDPRTHASKYYDWVRVHGTNIEVWEMNNLTRKRIERQIEDIYHDENEYSDDDSWKDSPKFNLSILSTNKYVGGLTYNQLISGGEVEHLNTPNHVEVGTRGTVPTSVPGYQYQGG